MSQAMYQQPRLFTGDIPSREARDCLSRLDQKIWQLQDTGLAPSDEELIQNGRLKFIWALTERDPQAAPVPVTVTVWRHARARRAYGKIQSASDDIFLAAALTLTPTECARTTIEHVLDRITGVKDYEPYRLNLDPTTRRFFEETAVAQGFAMDHRYLRFMHALFPQPREIRQIKYAYSLIRPDDVPKFVEAVLQGIYTSNQWTGERTQGSRTSSCMMVIVPTDEDEDGSCNLRVNRNVLIDAIDKFVLSDLRLD